VQKLKALLRLRRGQPLSLGYFHDRRLKQWVDTKLGDPAIQDVFVFSSAMAGYVMYAEGTRRILDMVDVDSEKWTAYAETAHFPARLIWAREGRTLLAHERLAAARFDHSLFVSEHEWQRFITLAPETVQRTGWISNGVDFDYFSPERRYSPPFVGEGADIVFTGRMDYRPNIDAVQWFARQVLPALRQHVPTARFWIVGSSPTHDVRELATLSGVQVTSRVAKVAGISQLSINPVLANSGSQNAGANITIQQRVTGNLFITFTDNTAQGTQTVEGQYKVTPHVSISGTRKPNGGFAADVLIKKEH